MPYKFFCEIIYEIDQLKERERNFEFAFSEDYLQCRRQRRRKLLYEKL